MSNKEISAEDKLNQLSKQYIDACERLTLSQAQCIADSNNTLQALREFADLKDKYNVFVIEQLQKKPEPAADAPKAEPVKAADSPKPEPVKAADPSKTDPPKTDPPKTDPPKTVEPVKAAEQSPEPEKREDNLKQAGN